MIIGEYEVKDRYNKYEILLESDAWPLVAISIFDCIGLRILGFFISEKLLKDFFNNIENCLNEAESFIFRIPFNTASDIMIHIIYNNDYDISVRVASTYGESISPIIMINTNSDSLQNFSAKLENDIYNKLYNNYI